ncbi:MAG TPA: TIGR02281 family clan AA aspartic protease [Ottowia sp.]|uniref:retropepsin-like aspartic protease family protein n=1 Tax=Ottowia sp. TaxID=1898956 RepID=UPI002CFE0DD0|nr:TIGR02281 family clan AA aspartic protease [Ottowia sp.]HMN20411.1 TIGR02281 family clan AA aspartic protease [Ottowia sp.]
MKTVIFLRRLLAGAALLPALAWAQNVTLHGTLGSKALLIIDGGAPRAMAPGESRQGVELLSARGDEAVVRVGGERLTLRVGESPVRVGSAPTSSSGRVALTADARGHFFTQGSINNRPVQFLVDTGASVVSISQAEADRLGLGYRAGQAVRLNTANGQTPGWALKLNQLRVGDITAYNVDAVVVPAPMPAVLLGNSFLNRFSMQREGSQLMLIRR